MTMRWRKPRARSACTARARATHTRLGVGGRMDTLQCAVVLGKLERFDWEVEQRLRIGARYQQLLADLPVQRLAVRGDRDCVWAQFTLMLDDRPNVQAALTAAGIPTAIHYPKPLHRQPAYAQPERNFPMAEAAAQRVISLPMSPDLSEAQQDAVIAALRLALDEACRSPEIHAHAAGRRRAGPGAAAAAGPLADPALFADRVRPVLDDLDAGDESRRRRLRALRVRAAAGAGRGRGCAADGPCACACWAW